MALNAQNFNQWNVEAVSQWLETIHLHSLIPSFERHNICGADLSHLDDSFMRDKLRITKPAELAALRGAIANLVDQAQPPPPPWPPNRGQPRKVSGPRERSTSMDKQKTFPSGIKKPVLSPNPPLTMPRYAPAPSRGEISTREPQLKREASAFEVLDDQCHYSGWIRKQGGGYKNCE